MKYTIEQKAQIMAVQNPNYTTALDFDDLVMITDGHKGYYIKKKDLVIDCQKLKKPITDYQYLNPLNIVKATVQAQKTRNVHLITDGGKMAIQLKSEDGKKAWVDMNFLKTFGDYLIFRISGEKDPVYICNYKGVPIGIVMPIKVCDEDADKEL